jgi:tetratricopeptide (TPR) repeat protein
VSESAGSLIDRALRARKERNSREARELFGAAIIAARDANSTHDFIRALKGLGQLDRDAGDIPAALTHYEEATLLCRKNADPLLAHTVRHLGDLYREMGRRDESATCYEEALAIYRQNASTSALDVANALRGFALLNETRGETDAATRLWAEARERYAQAGIDTGVAEAERRLAALRV